MRCPAVTPLTKNPLVSAQQLGTLILCHVPIASNSWCEVFAVRSKKCSLVETQSRSSSLNERGPTSCCLLPSHAEFGSTILFLVDYPQTAYFGRGRISQTIVLIKTNFPVGHAKFNRERQPPFYSSLGKTVYGSYQNDENAAQKFTSSIPPRCLRNNRPIFSRQTTILGSARSKFSQFTGRQLPAANFLVSGNSSFRGQRGKAPKGTRCAGRGKPKRLSTRFNNCWPVAKRARFSQNKSVVTGTRSADWAPTWGVMMTFSISQSGESGGSGSGSTTSMPAPTKCPAARAFTKLPVLTTEPLPTLIR